MSIIQPSTKFQAPLKQLAWQLYEMCHEEPLQMAQAIVLLPSRRAKRQFIEELHILSPNKTFILPYVSTLKDWANQTEHLASFLPPPVSLFERELHFIHLLKPHVSEEIHVAHFAESLVSLYDEFIFAETSFEKIKNLIPDAFAAHWQENLKYFRIIKDQWPYFLNKIGRSDPSVYFIKRLNAWIEEWKQNPPQSPIIAAGLELDIPVVRRLIEAIEHLPQGKVYQEDLWQQAEEKTIVRLLDNPAPPFQEEITQEDAFTQKLSLGEFGSLEEEARGIALLMREHLEHPDKIIALVTPLRALAQRVILELSRWNLQVDDSYGKSLGEMPLGLFLRLSLKCILKDFESISFLSLLKHPFTSQTYKGYAGKLEIQYLRGKVFASNLLQLLKEIPRGTELSRFLSSLQEWSTPLKQLLQQNAILLKDLIDAHMQFVEMLSQNTFEQQRGYTEFKEQLKSLEGALKNLKIKGSDYPLILEKLLNQITLRPLYGVHPRLHIWGPLEAQLQAVDCIIIGGMNEKNWPGPYKQSAWLNESMRNMLGLQTRTEWYALKKRLWNNLLRAPEVILTRAFREEGQLESASRWWLALAAKLKTKKQYEEYLLNPAYQQWGKYLDYPLEKTIISRPAPCPPLAARPRTLSVTQIETWIRDPYSIYAREILKLKPLAPLEPALGTALFGVMIHQILEIFFKQGYDVQDPQAFNILHKLGKNTFGESLNHPVVSSFWWTRFNRLISWFLEVEQNLASVKRFVEVQGEILLEGPHIPFKLKATADRIDLNGEGIACIIDYKTGRPPTRKDIEQGIMPQLPLEAAILQKGGFPQVDPCSSIAMRYMHLSGGKPAGIILDIPEADLIEKSLDMLQTMIIHYDNPKKPYLSCPKPEIAPTFSPYHHLSRIQEWQRL